MLRWWSVWGQTVSFAQAAVFRVQGGLSEVAINHAPYYRFFFVCLGSYPVGTLALYSHGWELKRIISMGWSRRLWGSPNALPSCGISISSTSDERAPDSSFVTSDYCFSTATRFEQQA